MSAIKGDIANGKMPAHKWAKSICESLGLNPKEVESLTIEFDAHDVSRIYVQMYTQGETELPSMPKEYRIIEAGD